MGIVSGSPRACIWKAVSPKEILALRPSKSWSPMKSHGLKLLECYISLSQINTHTIKNPYSIYTLAVRWSFSCNLFLCYKNQIFGIYKCRWLIWTIVTRLILSLFPTHVGWSYPIFFSTRFQKGSDHNAVNTWTFMVMERNRYYRTCKCNSSHCSVQTAQRRI